MNHNLISPQGAGRKNCLRTSGIRLYTFTRVKWATRPGEKQSKVVEGVKCWCHDKKMEQTPIDDHYTSVESSTQDLSTRSKPDYEEGEGKTPELRSKSFLVTSWELASQSPR